MKPIGILRDQDIHQIEKSKQRIKDHHLDFFVRKNLENLVAEANNQIPLQDVDNRSRKDEVISTFKDGWNYAIENYHEFSSDRGKFTHFLTEIGGRTEPSLRAPNQTYAQLRDSTARMAHTEYLPPVDKARINHELENIITLFNTYYFHPVEESFFLYYHIIRIQPLANSNKRVASIFMNAGLLQEDLPPIAISPDKFPDVKSLLFKGFSEFRQAGAHSENPLSPFTEFNGAQRAFYTFMTSQLLGQLNANEQAVSATPRYEVMLNVKDAALLYTAKRKVASLFRKSDAHEVNLDLPNRTLKIAGYLNPQSIRTALDKMDISYSLSSVREDRRQIKLL